jgi:hypothetical protein
MAGAWCQSHLCERFQDCLGALAARYHFYRSIFDGGFDAEGEADAIEPGRSSDMKSKLVICVLIALSASTIIASAQDPARGGKGAVGEGRRLNTEPRTWTGGYAMMRRERERRTVDQPELTVAPYINFDATEIAPAGR